MKPYYETELGKLYCGDALEIMPHLEPVDLVLTSPPYDNLRTYGGHQFDFEPVADGIKRALKIGGVCVWVVGDETINGSESGTSFKQALYFKNIGLNLHDTMIYLKTGFNNPSSNRYHQVFEYMFVFSNGVPIVFNPIKDRYNFYEKRGGRCVRQKDGTTKSSTGGQSLSKYGARFNVWQIPFCGLSGTVHPATFPIQLAQDHIISWSNECDLIADTMCGSGTTAVACERLNRRWIGIEIEEKYCAIAKQRIENERRQRKLF